MAASVAKPSTSITATALRQEIGDLGRMFGAVVEQFTGRENFELVERVRNLAAEVRDGRASSDRELHDLLTTLDERQLKVVIRSFTLFLELANLAEDRHRIRVLKQRNTLARPRDESVRAAIATLHERGLSPEEVQTLVDRLAIELVLTAHPTEAKRRSVRRILRNLQKTLADEDIAGGDIELRTQLRQQLACWLEILWHTDLIRPWRPTVIQEVERGLALLPVLWQVAPKIAQDLRNALGEYYPDTREPATPPIRFGSWIGGDRDGNPFVTPQVTEETLNLLRRAAIDAHREVCQRLSGILSHSERQGAPYPQLTAAIDEAAQVYPQIAERIETKPPLESYRRWLVVIAWRLERTAAVDISEFASNSPPDGAYISADELLSDVQLIGDSLLANNCRQTLEGELAPWIDQIRTFGFHTSRLDVRQHSSVYREVLNEIWRQLGASAEPEKLGEDERVQLLIQSMGAALPTDVEWSPAATETFQLFALIRRVARRFGMAALGKHVLSMTAHASDVLTILWLWKWSESAGEPHVDDAHLILPIVPLFETINDLDNAADTLEHMFAVPEYREHLRALHDRQTVMIGYSDSTKDGGYVAAQWALYRSQIEQHEVAERCGVTLTFFHGRGGSLGRGGGPAARSILSLPPETFSGRLRLTEQGEVLAERYDNPHIAHRHLEQVTWSSLIASAQHRTDKPHWSAIMDRLAREAYEAYRKLVDTPSFADYYRAITPLNFIERLPIGSRPAKRKASNRIEDLRAIPWVFSWTQNRCLLPAWFGLGIAYQNVTTADMSAKLAIAAAYQEWAFFTSAIDNAALALAKANMDVFLHYCELGNNVENAGSLSRTIIGEFALARTAVLEITRSRELLDSVPWLQQSIQVRNGYVDPLNLVQVELINRCRRAVTEHGEPSTELAHLTSLTVKGIATGMRTTG
ncbi:MAG: phosphoenolpyruvate carboxylase [Pirellulales bacterium]